MTKRACPFDATIYRQMKVHVMDYENDINAKKEIQEKTMKKLMTGSQLLLPNTCSIQAFQADTKFPIACAMPGPSTSSCSKTRIIKQQQVTNYFGNGKKPCAESNSIPNKLIDNGLVCFYCDNKNENIHQCPNCQENFCQSCSFISYGKADDVWICMSCS